MVITVHDVNIRFGFHYVFYNVKIAENQLRRSVVFLKITKVTHIARMLSLLKFKLSVI